MLKAIAVFKLFKTALLSCLGIGALELLNPAVEQRVIHWAGSLAGSYDSGFVQYALSKLTGLSAVRLKELGIGAFFYALLFLTEGIGLWFSKRWAEYLTLIATGSLLPIEIYEIYMKISAQHGLALALNLIVFIYLAAIVRRKAV